MKRKAESNQEVMESLYPAMKEYHVNSLVPLITKYDNPEEPIAVSFLFKGDDIMLKEFRAEEDGGDVDVNIRLKAKKTKKIKDLLVRFDFVYKTGHPMMETYIPGENSAVQRDFVNALWEVDHFYFFICDENCKLLKVKTLDWNPEEHSNVLNLSGADK